MGIQTTREAVMRTKAAAEACTYCTNQPGCRWCGSVREIKRVLVSAKRHENKTTSNMSSVHPARYQTRQLTCANHTHGSWQRGRLCGIVHQRTTSIRCCQCISTCCCNGRGNGSRNRTTVGAVFRSSSACACCLPACSSFSAAAGGAATPVAMAPRRLYASKQGITNKAKAGHQRLLEHLQRRGAGWDDKGWPRFLATWCSAIRRQAGIHEGDGSGRHRQRRNRKERRAHGW